MESLTLSAGLLLPWLSGATWLMAIEGWLNRGARPNRLRQAGYGFFLGYAVLYLATLACHFVFGQVSWPWVMTLLAILAVCGGIAFSLVPGTPDPALPAPAPLGAAARSLLLVLAAWTALHLFFMAVEVFSRPVYPWDAWLAWVYRAKAWYLAGGMVDVVSSQRWAVATTAEVYTIDAWTYPRFPSVIPYWAALSLGRWSETLVNLPALLAGSAVGLALYGQCRESGLGPTLAVAACYLLFSVPLFATHVALAGYADLWMAGFCGLGFIALLRGAVSGPRFQTLLGLLMIALAIGVKNEGAVWFLAALLMQALITFRWRTLAIAGVVLTTAVWIGRAAFGISHLQVPLMGTLGVINNRLEIPFIGSFALEVHNVWRVYLDNFFMMGSWNLLWLLVAVSLVIAALSRKPLATKTQRAGATFILVFLACQLFIFGFTDQGVWADTYTAINRLPLHFLPALLYAAFMILNERMAPAAVPQHRSDVMPERGFSTAFLFAASLIAALLVFAGTVAFLARGLPGDAVESRQFAATELEFVMGSGRPDGMRAVIDGFTDGYALLSSGPVELDADNFRFLRITLNRLPEGEAPVFFWRRGEAPADLVQVRIHESGTPMIDLSRQSDWRGDITELGFLFHDDGGEALAFGPATLEPDSLALRMRLVWNSWTAFEDWSQKSINFLNGGTFDQPVRLPLLAMSWIALALTLAGIFARLSRRKGSRELQIVGAAVFLAAWMILDLRWTTNTLRQSAQTLDKYWSADAEQRLSRGLDGSIYRDISRLKADVLPGQPSRILLIADDQVPDYFLKRAKYHLLPHSAAATRKLSPKLSPDTLNFVLFLGETGGFERLRGPSSRWRRTTTPVDEGPYGDLYRVENAPR